MKGASGIGLKRDKQDYVCKIFVDLDSFSLSGGQFLYGRLCSEGAHASPARSPVWCENSNPFARLERELFEGKWLKNAKIWKKWTKNFVILKIINEFLFCFRYPVEQLQARPAASLGLF